MRIRSRAGGGIAPRPPQRAARPRTPSATEQILEASEVAHERAQRVAEIEVERPSADPRPDARVPEAVVARPLVGIAQHLVGLADLLELLLRLRSRVDVRVQFPGGPPVGALDLLFGCPARDA